MGVQGLSLLWLEVTCSAGAADAVLNACAVWQLSHVHVRTSTKSAAILQKAAGSSKYQWAVKFRLIGFHTGFFVGGGERFQNSEITYAKTKAMLEFFCISQGSEQELIISNPEAASSS